MKAPSMTFILFLMFGFIANNARAQVTVGSSPKCALYEGDKKTDKWKEIWTGFLPPEYQIKHQPWTQIVWRDGSLDISSKDWKTISKIHDGRTTIQMIKLDGEVQITIGHIDSSNAKNPVPSDASIWVSDDSKEFGMIAIRRKLLCSLR